MKGPKRPILFHFNWFIFPDCQDAIDEFEENYEKNKKNSRRRKRKKSDTEFNPANIKIDTAIAIKTGKFILSLQNLRRLKIATGWS